MSVTETILKIRKEMKPTVAKNGYNSFHKYKFAKATDIINHCRELCDKHGLLITPCGLTDISYTKNDTVISGNVCYSLSVKGDSMNVVIFAAGEDKGDKSAYKLMTGALKYLLMQVFLLETDDDPEASEPTKPKAKPTINTTQIEKAKAKIDEEGEAYLLKIRAHYALTQEQDIEFTEYINYTKG